MPEADLHSYGIKGTARDSKAKFMFRTEFENLRCITIPFRSEFPRRTLNF